MNLWGQVGLLGSGLWRRLSWSCVEILIVTKLVLANKLRVYQSSFRRCDELI